MGRRTLAMWMEEADAQDAMAHRLAMRFGRNQLDAAGLEFEIDDELLHLMVLDNGFSFWTDIVGGLVPRLSKWKDEGPDLLDDPRRIFASLYKRVVQLEADHLEGNKGDS